jgi:signal transduction histidine kinase
VQHNLERAAELIANFKKLAVDQASDDVVELDLADYLNGLGKAHSPELRKRHANFKVDVASSIRVRLPAGMLAQIVSNLLMNALTHGLENKDQGEVLVSGSVDGRDLLLSVSDNGAGVPVEILSRLMEPFFTTKRGRGGTGLGLHIVYTLIQRLEGTISLSSAPGQGLQVNMRIPGCVLAN